MGRMKDLLITIYGGGDEAVEAAKIIAGLSDFTIEDDEPRWIPVSERLPVDGYIVVGYASPDTIEVSEFHADDGRFWCVRGGWFNATHWMPLPEPPG